MADRMVFFRTSLIGGAAGSLDLIDGLDRGDGNALQDGDMAFTIDTGELFCHTLDADSGLAENSPLVVRPDTNAGDMRWIQQSIPAAGYLAIADIDDTPVDSETSAPISSNWAYDHAALKTAHGLVVGTAENDFMVAGADPFAWAKKTLAQVKTILGLSGVVPAGAAVGDFIAAGADPFAWEKKTKVEAATILKDQFPQAITDNHVVTVDSADAADDEYARFTANGIEGRSAAEVKADLHPAPGAIGETTPDTIRGKNKEIYKTASADSPLTAAECSGTIVSNYGMTDADCVISLPAAVEGLAFVCILPAVRARYFRLDPDAGDSVYLSGVTTGDGKYVGVASGYAAATAASFFTFKTGASAYDWFCVPIFGTWVAEA